MCVVQAPHHILIVWCSVCPLNGHESRVRLILAKEGDVDETGGHPGSTLQVASFSGHESVVQMLLDKGADVSISGGGYARTVPCKQGHTFDFLVHKEFVELHVI